jgi:hypothetical protein
LTVITLILARRSQLLRALTRRADETKLAAHFSLRAMRSLLRTKCGLTTPAGNIALPA